MLIIWDKNLPIGCCHFRRTWAGGIYIDFLAALSKNYRGIGTGLLFHVASIAGEIGAPFVWGEATEKSAAFYKKIFELDEVDDLFRISAADCEKFRTKCLKKWQPLTASLRDSLEAVLYNGQNQSGG